MSDPYEVLGVPKSASSAEIVAAYRRLCLRYHPDKHAGADAVLRELAEAKFKEIQSAYEALSNSEDRSESRSTADAATPSGRTSDVDDSTPPAGRHAVAGRRLLGAVLVELGLLSQARLRVALRVQATDATAPRLGEILVEQGACDPEEIAKALSRQRRLPFCDLADFRVSAHLAALIPLATAAEHRLVPIRVENSTLIAATDEPDLIDAQSALARQLGMTLQLAVTDPLAVREALNASNYGAGQGARYGFWSRLFRFIEEHPEGPVEAIWTKVRPRRWPFSGGITLFLIIGVILVVYLLRHEELGMVRWIAIIPIVIALVGYALLRGLSSWISRIGRK